ncbi:putative F-box/LRR-repeat protein At5g41840 [Panicum hallii]|uniref:putative F-box/LRR-repeat protein At5g41840 n=1 Tax=Panicum hallii TaxID=206008 RepID=UPI000DF4D34E|nr:putative F-box/LRR-repeat protein At5g41840 [Panicum hallii]
MAPLNPNTAKRKATGTLKSAKCGVAKRVPKNPKRGGTRSSPTADEGDLQDRINTLPDDMLCCILTLLGVHDAARTTVLSKRWQHLFRSPECQSDTIDDKYVWHAQRQLNTDSSWSMWEWRCPGITSALLASLARPRRICRFIIQQTLPWDSELSLWLKTLSQGGVVEEIVLEMPYLQVCLPHFIFNCSSLRSLSLSCLRWPLIDVPNGVPAGYIPSWMLPFLVELTLNYMDMTTRDTEDLLRRCPALLSLSICYSLHVQDRSLLNCDPNPVRGSQSLTIRCENLLNLTIQDGVVASSYDDEVSIVHAPKLERLLLVFDPL